MIRRVGMASMAAAVLAIVGGFFALASCSVFTTAPDELPAGAVQVLVPSTYLALWQQVDSCTGRPRYPYGLSLYVVSFTPIAFSDHGALVVGLYQSRSDRIVLASWVYQPSPADTAAARRVVEHEMVHAHLGAPDPADLHPREYFVDRCGSLLGQTSGAVR